MMEILTTNSIQLNFKQKEALENGMKKRERMRLLIENITQLQQSEKYSNLYIYSPPGLGKTHMENEYFTIDVNSLESFLENFKYQILSSLR